MKHSADDCCHKPQGRQECSNANDVLGHDTPQGAIALHYEQRRLKRFQGHSSIHRPSPTPENHPRPQNFLSVVDDLIACWLNHTLAFGEQTRGICRGPTRFRTATSVEESHSML